MKDIHDSIVKASDSSSALSARHEAFAQLVLRFQDMAFACAYTVLGDAYLAEDIAQDSFVIAWQKLDQLREPKAFPGWFKRIVLSQCNRITRRKHLQVVSIDFSDKSPTSEFNQQAIAEKDELLNRVLKAIKALPEKERLVTTLFYVNGYTQTDISQFLEVPVSTVNKRLHTARQRLKESVDVFKENLKNQRPSRDQGFSDRVHASLRPLVESDWPPIRNLVYARQQTDVPGNEQWLKGRQNFDESNYFRRQYVAEAEDGQVLGFGSIEQTIYLPKYLLFIVANPRWLNLGVGDLLWERLSNDLKEANAVSVLCRAYSSQTHLLDFLQQRGFKELDRVLDLRLDVAAADVCAFLPVFEKLGQLGITITTLAEERRRDPQFAEKLHELTSTVVKDDPARAPFAPPAYNAREALLWLKMPYVLPDAYFIARYGERYVGVCDVGLFQALPGGLTHGFSGVLREYRRQGLATALKLSAIEYARRHGYKLIQSSTRYTQAAILSLNEKLGFRVISSYATLEKCLREMVGVDPILYDDYAGHYRDDEHRPILEMVVRNESGRLTLEVVGQKVELFPSSEREFFVKPFYGEATFSRDENGRVGLLKLVTPDYKTRKTSVEHAKRVN